MATWRETRSPEPSAKLPDLLSDLLLAVMDLQEADLGNVSVYDAQRRSLRMVAQHGFDPSFLDRYAEMRANTKSVCGAALVRHERVVVEDVTADPHWSTVQPIAAAAHFRAVQATPLTDRGAVLGILSTYFREPHRPSERELRLTDFFARQAGYLIGARLKEEALRSNEERLQFALEAAGMGTWSWDPSLDLAVGDARTLQTLGVEPGTTLRFSESPQRYLHPDDIERYLGAVARALDPEGSGHLQIEFRWIRPDGRQIWLQQCGRTSFQARAGQRQPVHMNGTMLDITERKLAEERQLLLTREVDHRAKNLLATIQAMISLSAASREDLGEFVATINSRLVSLARAHELLAVTHWAGASVRKLIQNELSAYTCDKPEIATLRGEDLMLKPAAATALSMVIHELATNAAKYGALSVPHGRVEVAWSRDNEGVIALQWQEIHGPPVQAPRHKGFGSQLVLRSLELELGGSAQTYFEPQGVRCTVRIPACHIASRPRSN